MDTLSSRPPKRKWYTGHPIPIEERFWSKVDKSNECWIWMGSLASTRRGHKGYGNFTIAKGKSALAHRFAYELTYGPIPKGMYICHRCNDSHCVNPEHLYVGTPQDNVNDREVAGHSAKGARVAGSKLIESQVREIREKYNRGGVTFSELADEYGVRSSSIYQVIKRLSWKHI